MINLFAKVSKDYLSIRGLPHGNLGTKSILHICGISIF